MKKMGYAVLLSMAVAVSSLTGCGSGVSGQAPAPAASDDQMTSTAAASSEAATSAAVATSAAASSDSGDGVTITFGSWGNDYEIEAYKKMAEGVSDAVPGVKEVKFITYASTDDFWNNIPSQMAAGTAPDLIYPTDENAYEYIKGGLYDSIDTSAVDLSNVSSDALKVWTVDDKLYGIPLTMQPTCLLLNLDLFKKFGYTDADYPKSWDDVRKIAEKVSDPKNNFYGLCLYMENPFHFTQVLQGFVGSWGDGKTIDSDKNEAALQWAIDMFKDGLAVSPTQLGDHWDGETFAANKCLMTTGGVWYYGQMQSAAPNTNYIALPIPQQNWDTPACSLHSSALVILKNCQHKDLASKVAAYMSRVDSQKINTEASGAIPSNPGLKEEYFKTHTQFTQLNGEEKYAVSFGYPAKTTEFETDFVNAVTAVIYDSTNNTSAKDILSQLQSQYGE